MANSNHQLNHSSSSIENEPCVAVNRDDELPSSKNNAKLSSTISSPSSHSECLAEAKESPTGGSSSPSGSLIRKLSPELREKIYVRIFREEPEPRANLPATTRLAILLVCRQLHSEACHIYYAINHFRFPSMSSIVRFSTALSPVRCRVLTSVEIDGSYSTFMTAFSTARADPTYISEAARFLALCGNLRELTLSLPVERVDDLDALRGLQRGLKKVEIELLDYCRPFGPSDSRVAKPRAKAAELRRILLRSREDVEGDEGDGIKVSYIW